MPIKSTIPIIFLISIFADLGYLTEEVPSCFLKNSCLGI